MRRLLALGLLLATAGVASAAPPDAARDAGAGAAAPSDPAPPTLLLREGGMLWLRPNPDALRSLRARSAAGHGAHALWSLPLEPRRPLRIELGDGAPTRFVSGELGVPALRLERAGGGRTPLLRLQPEAADPLGWRLVDARGQVWLRISHAMRSPDLARDGVRLVTADLRIGPALASWGGAALEGALFGNVTLHLPLTPAQAGAMAKSAKSCSAPNWPGTAGFRTDVQLLDMIDVGNNPGITVLRCRTGAAAGCDGPGGLDGEVVFVPAALLRNRVEADAADVPWYLKFSTPRPPYGNDQHPYLVWNMYRIDGDGRLEQIGQSGLKHAFATANSDCLDATCPPNGNILGRACQDIYNAGSNDFAFMLGPRSELVPATGVWGRCGSVFDDTDTSATDGLDGCDAIQDAPGGDDFYRYRLVVREADIEPASNPGSQWFIDAWYVVRGDEDIYNSMGHRRLVPTWGGSSWNPGTIGAFRAGSVLDSWLESAPLPLRRDRRVLASGEGQVLVATRVLRLPDGRYRYDYAVANLDFSRAVIAEGSSEPNVRLLRNLGLDALELELRNGATVEASEYRDGDATAANDWPAAAAGSDLRWTAPSGATLDWGRQVFLRVTSASAPAAGQLRLRVAEPGNPAQYALNVPVPDAAQLFGDSFE